MRLQERASRLGTKTAILYRNETTSYGQLVDRVLDLAQQWDLDKGSGRILILEPDPLRLLIAILTCWRSGKSAALLRPDTPADVLRGVEEVLNPSCRVTAGLQAGDREQTSDGNGQPHHEECLIVSTSGTMGHPKLAALPATGVQLNAETISENLGFCVDDRVLVSTPLTYCYGLIGGVMAGLWSGAQVDIFGHNTVPTVLQNHIRRHGITVVQGPPALHRLHKNYWNQKPFTAVRLVTQGGEPCERELADWLRQSYPHARRLQLFGMTEASPRISHIEMDDPRAAEGGMGQPYSHLRWFIDGHDTVIQEPENQGTGDLGPGPLCLAGPAMFLGYPQRGGGYEGKGADGVFRTNDIVSCDSSGCLFLHGRSDRCFKSGGRLINPEIVELALKNVAGVNEALCLPNSHDVLGFVPVAQVAMDPGIQIEEGALLAACSNYLEAFQMPRSIQFISGFQTSLSGKRLVSDHD